MPVHPLHQAIGRLLDLVRSSLPPERRQACVLIKDPALLSGPTPDYVRVPQNIPLFCSTDKSNATEYCNVDALILLGDKIKVIVEIEESGRKPTHVFGKFLASAAALCYIHEADGGAPVYKDDDVLFVQVMDTSALKSRSSKKKQWTNIAASICSLLPVGSLRRYVLLAGDQVGFAPGQPVAMSFADSVTAVLIGDAPQPDEVPTQTTPS